MLSNEQKAKIVGILNSKIKDMSCPMCQNKKFSLAEGYFSNPLQADITNFNLGGPSVPTASIICQNCGFISQHALGILGLL